MSEIKQYNAINKEFIIWLSRTLNAEQERVNDPKNISIESVQTETQRQKWVNKQNRAS